MSGFDTSALGEQEYSEVVQSEIHRLHDKGYKEHEIYVFAELDTGEKWCTIKPIADCIARLRGEKRMGDELVIETGIPVPERYKRHGHEWAVKIRAMKPGDSILFPTASRARVSSFASRMLGAGNYTCRLDGEKVRMWRIK